MRCSYAVQEAIRRENPHPVNILPLVATVVYRPPDLTISTPVEVLALVQREIQVWPPSVCPLCAQGSKPLRPKSPWAELTAKQ